ncbi:MAG: PRC-barrel domain-containing protein [Pararhodobacter sp.]|nr:PRC-barrel domain-containing protein [Pararhodobacter sp.]
MKKLMLTTALVAVTSLGAHAQTATDTSAPAQGQVQDQAQMQVPAFLASDFIGMNLYAVDHESVQQLRTQQDAERTGAAETGAAGTGAQDARSIRWTSSDAFTAQRDAWDNIGNIDDVVMTKDGEIRGVLVDVGGFLGLFAHTVMVDLDDLYFVADDAGTADGTARDVNDFSVVASMSREQLEALPEWNEEILQAGFEPRQYGTGQAMDQQQDMAPADQQESMMEPGTEDTTMQTDPATDPGTQTGAAGTMAAEGYTEVQLDERTAENLTGANVYDINQDNIGNVTDLVLDGQNAVTHVLVDVGGFLGMGSHTVALPVEEVNILWHDANEDVRVHVDVTRDQLETMPEYQG